MKNSYKFLLIIILISFVSCSKNQDVLSNNDFKGEYSIAIIKSSVPVDLNNDGIKNQNYLQEIMLDYILPNGEAINYGYNPNEIQNSTIARPLDYNSNNTKFLNLNFPIQRIDSLNIGNNSFVKINVEYRKMNTGLIYKLENGNILIDSDPFDEFEFYNIRNFTINRLSENTFETKFDFDVYDFLENSWIQTQLQATYEKVNE